MTLTKIAAAVAVSGAVGLAGHGFGSAIAYADPGHGHGHGHGDWGEYDGPREWRGPYYGPAYYGAPQACVSATGPYGYVSGSLCI
jgi:hypothetical protein